MHQELGAHILVLLLVVGVLLAGLALTAWCIWATVDVLRRPTHQWSAAGQNQVVWLVVVIGSWFVGLAPLGALLYWVIARPALRATERPTLAA